jgi:hypothetical protein
MIRKVPGIVLFVCLSVAVGYAQESTDQNNMPPQSAIDACEGKPVRTPCEFATPQGTKTGICLCAPGKEYFACQSAEMALPPQERREEQGAPGKGAQEESSDDSEN